jgi:aminoglycoside phosphotransferase (APT) family kinase protein
MDSSILESYLKDRMPELKDTRIIQLIEITDGWETEIYSFDAESDVDGEKSVEKLVLRMYSGPWAVHKAKKEFNLLKRLYEADYPVPKISLIEEDSTHLGRPFIVMERIVGHQMWSLLEPEEDNSKLFHLFSRLFYDLHKLDWRLLAEHPEEFEGLNSKKAVTQWVEKYESRAKDIGNPEILEVVDWLKREIDCVSFEELSPVHNDFHPNNILIDVNGNPFVIDWTAADIMDYRVDLAWTLLLTKIYGDDSMRDKILRGYENVRQKKVEHIGFFEVLGALRRLTDIIGTLDADSERIGLRAGASKVIREQLTQNMALLDIVNDHTGLELHDTRKIMVGEKT